MKNKKKKKHKLVSNQEQEDELTALAAIFQSDFHVNQENRDEFRIHVVPFPGEVDPDPISIDLVVKISSAYPRKPPLLRLQSPQTSQDAAPLRTLSPNLRQHLLTLLKDQAEELAQAGQVFVFNLAELAREFLVAHLPEQHHQHNHADLSLWENMQRRRQEEEEEGEVVVLTPSHSAMDLWWDDTVEAELFGELLHSDPALQAPPALPLLHPLHVKKGSSVTTKDKLSAPVPSHTPKVPRPPIVPEHVPPPRSNSTTLEGVFASDTPTPGSTSSPHTGAAALHPPPLLPASRSPAGSSTLARSAGRAGAAAARSPQRICSAEDRSVSTLDARSSLSAFVASLMSQTSAEDVSLPGCNILTGSGESAPSYSMGHSEDDTLDLNWKEPGETGGTTAVFGERESSEEEEEEEEDSEDECGSSEYETDDDDEEDEEAEDSWRNEDEHAVEDSRSPTKGQGSSSSGLVRNKRVQRELVVGRLLGMLCSQQGGTLPQALPYLAAQLNQMGIISDQLKAALVERPAMLDKAFHKVFTPQAGQDSASDPQGDSNVQSALRKFWRTASGEKEGMSGETSSSNTAPTLPASRYKADFEELSKLGQGGFGQVVLARNRLDGRKYAIKKIKMSDQSPQLNEKILREVATLSRLQHENIVRYFQAWCETVSAEELQFSSFAEQSGDLDEDYESDWLCSRDGGTAEYSAMRNSSWNTKSNIIRGREGGEGEGGGMDHSSSEVSRVEEGGAGGQEAQYLYIQMEYCPRTLLSEMPKSGVKDEDDMEGSFWRVMRQILEGLRHIHHNGMIHRDLKPLNVFLDPNGTVKIGDFGLAKFKGGGVDAALDEALDDPRPPLASNSTKEGTAGAAATGVVGTRLYTAPEIERGLPHDAKVDMFSLGIIAFELLVPFSTGMERVALLEDLRQHRTFPSHFPVVPAGCPCPRRLIHWLLHPDPSKRPTAREVLSSDMFGDELLNGVLDKLPHDQATKDRVLERMFVPLAPPPSPSSSAVSSLPLAAPQPPSPAAMQDKVMAHLAAVFGRHGGAHLNTRFVETYADVQHENGVRVLDSSGAMLTMRYDLRTQLASWVGGEGVQHLRRYEIGKVCRRSGSSNGVGVPEEFTQADFDIISPNHSGGGSALSHVLTDAEVIKVATEAVEMFPQDEVRCCVRVNHRALLSGAWAYAGLPSPQPSAPPPPPPTPPIGVSSSHHSAEDTASAGSHSSSGMRAQVTHVLTWAGIPAPQGQPPTARWAAARRQLSEALGLKRETIDRLETLTRMQGDAGSMLPRVTSTLHAAGIKLPKVLEELSLLLSHLRTWGVRGPITLHPLMPPHQPYLSRVFFQLHVERIGSAPSVSGPSWCVGAGGRFDHLIRTHWQSDGHGGSSGDVARAYDLGGAPLATGLSLSVHKLQQLLQHIAHDRDREHGGVLVCARDGGGLLRERMELVGELWAAGLHAQMVHTDSPSMREQYQLGDMLGVSTLVVLAESSLAASGSVTVKHLHRLPAARGVKTTEIHVPRTEVVRYLTSSKGNRRAPIESMGRLTIQSEETTDTKEGDTIDTDSSSRRSQRGPSGQTSNAGIRKFRK